MTPYRELRKLTPNERVANGAARDCPNGYAYSAGSPLVDECSDGKAPTIVGGYMTGEDVSSLQIGLVALGVLAAENKTGEYDNATLQAVRRFQNQQGNNFGARVGRASTTLQLAVENSVKNVEEEAAREELERQRREASPNIIEMQQKLLQIGFLIAPGSYRKRQSAQDNPAGIVSAASQNLSEIINKVRVTGKLDTPTAAALDALAAEFNLSSPAANFKDPTGNPLIEQENQAQQLATDNTRQKKLNFLIDVLAKEMSENPSIKASIEAGNASYNPPFDRTLEEIQLHNLNFVINSSSPTTVRDKLLCSPTQLLSTPALSVNETTSFPRYFSKRYSSIKELFAFFHTELQKDLKNKEQQIEVNGISFTRDSQLLDKTIQSLKDAMKDCDPKIASYLEDSELVDNRYQVTIVNDKYDNFIGVYLFFAGPQRIGNDFPSLLRFWIDKKHFITERESSARPFSNVFCNRYLTNLDGIANLGKEDLARAKNMMSCGYAPSSGTYNEELHYIRFSKTYHQPLPITGVEMSKKESSLWRSRQPVDVGSEGNIFTGAWDGAKDAMMSLSVDTYTVKEGDVLRIGKPADPKYPYGYLKKPDGSKEPSSLGKKMSRLSTYNSKTPQEQVLQINGIFSEDAAGTAALSRDEKKIKLWTDRSKKTGNALVVGEKIFLPRARADLSKGFNIDFSAQGALTEDALLAIWEKEIVDKLLLKICPAGMLNRIAECLLPTNCRELIEFLGLWKTRELLEGLVLLDSFDDKNGLQSALEQWDKLVESNYNFKAIHFEGGGLLSSEQFDATPIFSGDTISVSMQLRFEKKDNDNNGARTKYIMSCGASTSSGTFDGDGFSIRKMGTDKKVRFDIYSAADNKVASFVIDDSFLFDNKWHQLGFTWAGGTGNFDAYVDGRKVDSTQTSSSSFTGAMGSCKNARVVFASEKHNRPRKSLSGHVDEVCIFDRILDEQQWKTLSKINTDTNLKNSGMSQYAVAWWRMGDAYNDSPEKIVDMVGDVILYPNQEASGAQKIVIARLFEQKDYSRFIDLLAREANLLYICDNILGMLQKLFDDFSDPEALKEEILKKFKFPDFQKDPHSTIKVVIQDALVVSLVRMMAQFLMSILEKIMDCQNWKQMLKGLTKGIAAGGLANTDVLGTALQDSMKGTPIGDFVDAFNDPSKWEELLKQDFEKIQGAYEDLLNNYAKVQQGDDKPITLGLGTVQFTEEVTEERSLTHGAFDMGGSTISIQDSSTDTYQNTVINIAKKASDSLTSDEALGLFTSSPTEEALSKLTEALNAAPSENGTTYTQSEVAQITGQVGSFLGLQGAIDQLQYASQILNDLAPLPNSFCATSQDLSDRMGSPKTKAEKAAEKQSFQELLDQMAVIEETTNPQENCGIVIPLSDAENASLERTISDVFAPINSSFGNDLTLYKMGRASNKAVNKEIVKVWWKDEDYTKKVWNDKTQKLEPETFKCEQTQMNPEFETMIEQGFIPYKKDGKTIDGTKYGGVVKINWNPFNGEPWLKERRPPESLVPKAPENDGDDVQQPDVEIGDLWTSLGPYTDYTEEYAIGTYPKTSLTGKTASSLSDSKKNAFASSAAADAVTEDSATAGYFDERQSFISSRGIKNIETETRTSLVPSATSKSGRQKALLHERIQNSLSEITHTIPWGRSLSGEKLISFEKKGAQGEVEFSFGNVVVPFSLSTELKQALESFGYRDEATDCEDTSPLLSQNQQKPPPPLAERYIPQEYAFEDVVQKNFRTGIPSSVLKTDVYNSLYREVLTALMYKTADSPLLKPVPNLRDVDGEPMLALNFLNLDTDPNLLDMPTFSSQVAEDYSLLMSCPEGLTEPALYSAIKIGMPRILARLCIIELAVKAIIPFTQLFYSRKDPVIHEFILEKLNRDVQLYASDDDVFKAKVVEQYNKLAARGDIENPEIELQGVTDMSQPFRVAMSFFLEEEFDFIANRLKETIHGECIPESPERESDIKKGMYKAIFDYAELENKDIQIEYYAIMKETPTQQAQRVVDFNVRTQFEEIETLGASLTYSYNGKAVVLAKTEQSMEEFLKETELDLGDDDSLECDTASIYGKEGLTTEVENHRHDFLVDEKGNGKTSIVEGHEHAIFEYAVVPFTNAAGAVKHSHTLVPKTTQAAINEAFVEEKVFTHLKDKLIDTDGFKVMFDFCFNLNDIASFILTYCLVSVDDQIMSQAFSSTKKAIINMFGWLWTADQATDACETKEVQNSAKGISFEDMFPDIGDMFANPEFLLMMLLAPLNTYKGWVKIADPHVFITTTILDLLKIPVLPKNVKKNIPDIDNPGKTKCADIPDFSQAVSVADMLFGGMEDMWTFNGPKDVGPNYLATPIIELGVQAGVTFAPCIIGSPPYPATPFGYVYYFAVSPLIWALKDLPRILEQQHKNQERGGNLSDFSKNLMSTGLMQPAVLACFDDESTEEQEAAAQAANDEAPEEDGCPPVRDFTKTIIEAGGSADPADTDC